LFIEEKRLVEITDNFKDKKILVIGDLILDEFIWGDVKRISPEAPVPVIEVERESLRLGGSANVVNTLNALGCNVSLCGIVGDDKNGERLISILDEINIDRSGVVVKNNRPTAIKSRIIAQHQQIARFDREKTFPIKESTRKKIIAHIKKNIDNIDAVIVSDYGKGIVSDKLLSEAMPIINEKGLPVAIDPKPSHFPFYQKATIITPNHHEAAEALKVNIETDEDIIKIGQELLWRFDIESILITRGENGMSLFEHGGEITHIPTMARDVYDVTGAGDTVIATMTLALASGASLKEAAVLANQAAGIVVGKLGTATTTINEIKLMTEEL
jgi:D-beta-D-heptose 7-phosphate kinase/D-beta-D-heptose 1-phosphate adenosyltransferase